MSEQEHNEEQHNDPIERLFQDKAEEYDIEYNENDWLKLKNRLDQADRQRQRTIRHRWIAAAALLAFAFLGYLTIDNQMQINRLNDQLSQYRSAESDQPAQAQTEDPSENQDEATSSDETDKLGTAQKTSPTSDKKSANEKQEPPATRDNPQTESDDQNVQPGEQQKQSTPNLAAADTLSQQSADDPRTEGKWQNRRVGDTPKIAAIAMQRIATSRLQDANIDFAGIENINALEANLPPDGAPVGISSHTPSAIGNKSGMLAASSRSPASSLLDRFSIGVIVGPDLSTVGSLSNFYNPGYEYGVTIEYNLGSNLGIATGLIRSRVKYTASGQEYNPAGNYWGYGSRPRQTIGDCVLLDIPLQLKYNFWNLDGSRFYAVGGISSYIMLSEKYQFDYGYGYGSNRPRQWSDDTGTRHWMSNASLSIGYEYDLPKNWSLRAAPYLKIPIKEVGWGNVKLYSMGMTVSFNYNL